MNIPNFCLAIVILSALGMCFEGGSHVYDDYQYIQQNGGW